MTEPEFNFDDALKSLQAGEERGISTKISLKFPFQFDTNIIVVFKGHNLSTVNSQRKKGFKDEIT